MLGLQFYRQQNNPDIYNNAMSALIGFGKITHELKNRQAAGRHLNLGRSPIPVISPIPVNSPIPVIVSERKMVGA